MDWLIALGIGAATGLPVLVLTWFLIAEDPPPDEGFDAFFDASGPDTSQEMSMWSGIAASDLGTSHSTAVGP